MTIIKIQHKKGERHMAREILFELGKMITDRLPYQFVVK